jgi:hypothetical protein
MLSLPCLSPSQQLLAEKEEELELLDQQDIDWGPE